MKNDITRATFHRVKHFSRVLMQQGRVQLDADWNEQVSILLHYLQALTTDLVGPAAGPQEACGFELIVKDDGLSEDDKKLFAKSKKVLIGPGRYYVGGLLAEEEKFVSFFDQLGRPVSDDADKKLKDTDEQVVIYLDVWERHITPIEDDDIREKALGGPDTATRAKITWVMRARVPTADEAKVKLPPVKADIPKVRAAFDAWGDAQSHNRGLMRAGIEQQSSSDDPCANSPESVYRGMENQLYRVEIHRSGPAWDADNEAAKSTAATFKWSRDNGSVAASWLDTDGDVLKITALHDEARGFSKGHWVELNDDRRELEGRRGKLIQLKEVEAGSLTIDPQTADGSVDRSQFKSNPKVRRWDQQATETIELNKGAIPIVEDEWITLEDGAQIQFQKPAEAAGGGPGEPHQYRTGDYWLIPARVATRDIEWPWAKNSEGEILKDGEGKPIRLALPPHGITHHYALLGLLAAAAGGTFEFTDLRRKFSPFAS
jgi:hypothetical protein